MKRKNLLIFIILFAGHFANSQRLTIKQENLAKILKASTKGEISNEPWTTIENSFLKSDTIVFYNNQNYQQLKNGCNYKNWRFIDSKTFSQNESMICAEPTEETVYLDDKGLFTVELKEKRNRLFLTTFQKDQVVNKFRVIGLEEVILDEFTGKTIKLTLLSGYSGDADPYSG